jgi:hypothetical protein
LTTEHLFGKIKNILLLIGATMNSFLIVLPIFLSVFTVRVLPKILLAPITVVLVLVGNRLAGQVSRPISSPTPSRFKQINRGAETFEVSAPRLYKYLSPSLKEKGTRG